MQEVKETTATETQATSSEGSTSPDQATTTQAEKEKSWKDNLPSQKAKKEKKSLLASMSKPVEEKTETKDPKAEETLPIKGEKKKLKAITEETVKHYVTFELTEEEFAQKGKSAAGLQSEINKLNFEFKSVRDQHKANVTLREEEISSLLSTIKRGKEDREVEVRKVYDFKGGLVTFFHKGKKVEERPMHPGEKQMQMAV